MRQSHAAIPIVFLALGVILVNAQTTRPDPTPRTAASTVPVTNLADILQRELALGTQQMNSAQTAYDVYCKCPPIIAQSKQLCESVSRQCKASFCMPICTRMSWTPRLEVHCDRAPGWDWCPNFAKEVKEAETAVTAQFQAHTCLQHKFCNRTEEFIDWIENHTYGQHYPNHRLPIRSCRVAEDNEAQKSKGSNNLGPAAQAGAAAAAAAAGHTVPPQSAAATSEQNSQIRLRKELLCAACRRVIDVSIVRGKCQPANTQHVEVLQEGSLQDRCLFVADVIGSRATQLLTELKENACSCLGCCGEGTCYFPNIEKQWLSSLVESVQKSIKSELSQEGWHFEL